MIRVNSPGSSTAGAPEPNATGGATPAACIIRVNSPGSASRGGTGPAAPGESTPPTTSLAGCAAGMRRVNSPGPTVSTALGAFEGVVDGAGPAAGVGAAG